MALPIDVIGMGADGLAGLRPELVERIRAADFLAGGERHLRLAGPTRGERFVIKNNVESLTGELRERAPRQRCVVLASGDPLFYGIGKALLDTFPYFPDVPPVTNPRLRIEPAVSSMQLAFARAQLDWQDAALASVHGRDLRLILLPLLGRPKIGLFTSDSEGPAHVARFFLDHGADHYQAVVGEALGTTDEKVHRCPSLATMTKWRFGALNFVILYRSELRNWPVDPLDRLGKIRRLRALAPGVPDDTFERPEDGPEVMTRQEVRSVLLGKLVGPLEPGDVLWDIGAGLGTVAVELAVLRPAVEIVAVERDPGRVAFLHKNRAKFEAFNVRVLEGSAPEVLATESLAPRVVFIGGSGSYLPAILDEAARRLLPNGRLVANFVTLENLTLAVQRLREWQWPFEVTEVHISRSDSLAGLTGLKPQRGVFIVSANKRGAGRE